MELWSTRKCAMAELKTTLRQEAQVIEQGFLLVDECIELLHKRGSPLTWTCGLCLVKARALALGSYSLMLDGLAQEAGALLRPLIEALEKVVWFTRDPTRLKHLRKKQMPRPGKIAKDIEGEFRELRNHLNEHASHFELTPYSLKHLMHPTDGNWVVVQPHITKVLRKNMGTLFAFMARLAVWGGRCLYAAGARPDALAERIEAWKKQGLDFFREEKPA